MHNVFIAGATSAIAQETAKHFAAAGDRLFLVARNEAKLQAVAEDLQARGAAKVATFILDMDDVAQHEALWQKAEEEIGPVDTVFVAYGVLPDQNECQQEVEATLKAFTTNALSPIAFLTLVANEFEQRRHGTIAVISSVAGDRGRQSNYVYGSAKGALSLFLQGLRNRLSHAGVQVITIKPGFVDTPMTAHLPKNFLFAKPAQVGERIYRAMEKAEDTLYVPWFWYFIMLIIKAIPESIFKRLKM